MKNGVSITIENGRRIVKGLGYYEPRTVTDLRDLVKSSARKFGDATAFNFKDSEGKIKHKTYREFDMDIDCLGTALMSLGLKDSYIAIIGENRYEWGVCYFSVINGTGIAVPLDKHLPKNEIENLIERGKVEAIFFSPSFMQVMAEISADNNRIKYFICMENSVKPGTDDARFLDMPGLVEKGKKLLADGDKSFIEAAIDINAMSILLFTSGTTSLSKGVMLSHSNISSNITAITTAIRVFPEDAYLSLLPLHHTFENTVGLMFMVHSGVRVAYSDGIKHIVNNLKEYKITLLVAVPAIMEAMYRKVQEGIDKSGKRNLVNSLIKLSDFLRSVGIDVRKTLFKSIFNKFGPDLRLSVSGAAPLNSEVVTGFGKIGLTLIEGYGLTETSPVIAACNDFFVKPGTVGFPLYGIEVAVDNPDENNMGEIIVRGKNVMLGYFEDPEATAEAFTSDGWFRTGDLGIIEENGALKVTGRVKSMIVFTNGKKAFPEEYEALLNQIPGVKDSFAWGNKAPDGDIQVCAELVMDKEKLTEIYGCIPSEKDITADISNAVREINKNIPQYKIIRYFLLTYNDLAKTTKLSIKRPVELEKITGALKKANLDMRKASGSFIETLTQ
jgi:long-chain acyl-CoA synthetase